MNDWTPREFSIVPVFLNEGSYRIETASDGINSARNLQDYMIDRSETTNRDTLKIKLAPGGGFIARIIKN